MSQIHSVLFGTKQLLTTGGAADYRAMTVRRALRDAAERLMFVTGLSKRHCLRMVLIDDRKPNDPLPF
jgi:hypothetical protein